jgi:hypothetical protein
MAWQPLPYARSPHRRHELHGRARLRLPKGADEADDAPSVLGEHGDA